MTKKNNNDAIQYIKIIHSIVGTVVWTQFSVLTSPHFVFCSIPNFSWFIGFLF